MSENSDEKIDEKSKNVLTDCQENQKCQSSPSSAEKEPPIPSNQPCSEGKMSPVIPEADLETSENVLNEKTGEDIENHISDTIENRLEDSDKTEETDNSTEQDEISEHSGDEEYQLSGLRTFGDIFEIDVNQEENEKEYDKAPETDEGKELKKKR